MGTLTSQRYLMDNYPEAVEFYHSRGWSDGLSVVPPTAGRVVEFLDHVGLEPDHVIGDVPERNRVITAEKAAVNAVMADCLPEYFPVVVAAIEAITDPRFKFNHLASLGSPWPLIIVNGPVARQIGMNSGMYLFGPGVRPNATIARAVSLLLRNCTEARVEGIQRGQLGNPLRWSGCIAENEETAWPPLHVQLGFDRDASTVTVVSSYPGAPHNLTTRINRPERLLNAVCYSLPYCNGSVWLPGTYTLFVSPHHAELFIRAGWSKEDVRNYVVENTRSSIAELKRRGVWGIRLEEGFSEELLEILPGDEETYVYLFKDLGDHQRYLVSTSQTEGRQRDVYVVVAGGNTGHRIAATSPYSQSTNPVTKLVQPSSNGEQKVPHGQRSQAINEIRAKLEVLDPTAGSKVAKIGLSPRLDSLAGKTIGVIWNGRPAGSRILYQVMETLKEKDGVRETVFRKKPFLGNIAPPALLEEMATRCDAVITGVGD